MKQLFMYNYLCTIYSCNLYITYFYNLRSYHNLTKKKIYIAYLQYKSLHCYNFKKILFLYKCILCIKCNLTIAYITTYCRSLRSRMSWSANSSTTCRWLSMGKLLFLRSPCTLLVYGSPTARSSPLRHFCLNIKHIAILISNISKTKDM